MKQLLNNRILFLIIVAVMLVAAVSCKYDPGFSVSNNIETPLYRQIPKALFITTGKKDANGTLAKGIVIALQALNQKGVVCRMETRGILYKPELLFSYNILILSTAPEYHDNDRNYSLSFMSDEELKILQEYVAAGGVLIAGDNVGRNYPDGTDRITVFGRLTPDNYALAECFGGAMEERYMEDHHIVFNLQGRFEGKFRDRPVLAKWTLVMDTVFSDSAVVFGEWAYENDTLPACIQNRYGKGTAYLLATSDFLEPVNAGGEFSSQQISDFYHYVIDDFQERNHIPFELNPWPENHDQAFCVSLNAFGDPAQYQRMFSYLGKENINATVFTNGLLAEETEDYLKSNDINLESSGYGYQRYPQLGYPEALLDIIKNENHWGRSFSGFRFPYTSPGHWGLMVLNEKEICYESSIGANNISFFHGSVVPHNLVISKDRFFTTSDILEIGPVYHDDYYFYKDFIHEKKPAPKKIQKAVQLYRDYLLNFWEHGVKPFNGAMVYIGHPAYVGKSDTTLIPLEALIAQVKKENAWITSLGEIAEFRNKLSQLRFFVKENGDQYVIHVDSPSDVEINNVCLRAPFKIEVAESVYGDIQFKNEEEGSCIIFTGCKGQELRIWKP